MKIHMNIDPDDNTDTNVLMHIFIHLNISRNIQQLSIVQGHPTTNNSDENNIRLIFYCKFVLNCKLKDFSK
jgi:hypothetical protein